MELYLPEEGSRSRAELDRLSTALHDEQSREKFRLAFRLALSSNLAARDPSRAVELLLELSDEHPDIPGIYRVLGNALVSDGFRIPLAFLYYEHAVHLKPDYPEAHYALAYMYRFRDRARGKSHFDFAMKAGMVDDMGIGPRFYGW